MVRPGVFASWREVGRFVLSLLAIYIGVALLIVVAIAWWRR